MATEACSVLSRSVKRVCRPMPCLVALVILALSFSFSGVGAQMPDDQQLMGLVQELNRLMREQRPQNPRIFELDRQSKEAFNAGKPDEAYRLLQEAVTLARKEAPQTASRPARSAALKFAEPRKKVTVSLPVSSSKVICTEVAPNAASGDQVADFSTAFKQETLVAKDGKVDLTLGASPVIVEEVPDTPPPAAPSGEVYDSAFGIHGIEHAFDSNMNYLKELGVKWVVYAGPSGAVWDILEPRPGQFDWSRMDSLYRRTCESGVEIMSVVLSANSWDRPVRRGRPEMRMPSDMEAYKRFLTTLVERYNGNGKADAPGSPVVRYWQIENEVDTRMGWQDSVENYAELLRAAYKTVKQTDPNARVALAGISSPGGYYKFFAPMFDYMAKRYPGERYFDLVSFHWSGQFKGTYKARSIGGRSYELQSFVADLRNRLDSLGFTGTPIWITELSDYDGKPNTDPIDGEYPPLSETQQAASLFKSHVYALVSGVQKAFWSTIIEFHNWGGLAPNNYFDNIGLVRNPLNDGRGQKKLSYYTYGLMTEKLDGCRFQDAEIIPLRADTVACKLVKDNRRIYAVWYDDAY